MNGRRARSQGSQRSAERGNQRAALFASAIALILFRAAHAEDFEKVADEALRHTESGWIFPKAVGDFQRVGEPQKITGTRDCAARYDRSANGLQSTATVYLYPADSPAADASLDGAKAAIVADLKNTPLVQLWSEGPFRAGKTLPLLGEKAFYKVGIGPQSSQTNLYYFDTGKWVVKVRLSVQKTEEDTFQKLDTFVRDLPWDSLGLSTDSCTGPACRTDRLIAAHGALPEQLAMLLITSKLKEVFPREMPPCDAGTLGTVLTAESATQAEGEAQPLEVMAACAPRKGWKASFLRMTLAEDILLMLETRSPDGLSLRGPISFVALNQGKNTIYTQMHDGKLDGTSVGRILEALNAEAPLAFATADKSGKNPKSVPRFIN
jgi:hypothetical protein